MEENYEQSVSKFDSTVAVLMRLDALWKDAHRHSRQGSLMQWNWDLDRVWIELVADAKPEQIIKFNEMKKTIQEKKSDQTKLYEALTEKEIFLKLLEKEQGKGVGYQDSMEDYMD